jgi:hypothetical protein
MKNVGRGRVSLTKAQRQSDAGAELLSLCQTVTEDGTISEEEVAALREWLDENAAADLPAQQFLAEIVGRIIADGKVTPEERDEIFHAVEAVLPPDIRESARSRHRSLDAAERLAAREERDRQRPVGTWDFMVAGVSHEGRAAVVERHAEAGQRAFVVRDRANRFSRNAVEVRLGNGMCVGYVPEEYAVEMAPDLDDGCLHTAVVKKILGRRNIPVIVATLYRPEAEVLGLVAETAVPKTAAPAGCSGAAALVVVGATVFLALALAGALRAQEPGDSVRVETRAGGRTEGRFLRFAQAGLLLRGAVGDQTIPHREIQRIDALRPYDPTVDIAVGAAAGALALAIGPRLTGSQGGDLVVGAIGGAVCGVIQYLVRPARWRRVF